MLYMVTNLVIFAVTLYAWQVKNVQWCMYICILALILVGCVEDFAW